LYVGRHITSLYYNKVIGSFLRDIIKTMIFSSASVIPMRSFDGILKLKQQTKYM